jgi:hypothetical protein
MGTTNWKFRIGTVATFLAGLVALALAIGADYVE